MNTSFWPRSLRRQVGSEWVVRGSRHGGMQSAARYRSRRACCRLQAACGATQQHNCSLCRVECLPPT